MQTFVPYADFDASAAVLDDSRLGKQRVETLQILRALVFPSYKGWKNHPATRMWRGFTDALVSYGIAMCDEWERRGRADAVRLSLLEFSGGSSTSDDDLRRRGRLPLWWGLPELHASHRSALVRKLPEHYRGYFPEADPDEPYHWPAPLFPTWPIRARGEIDAPADDARAAAVAAAVAAPGPTLWVHGAPYDDTVPPLPSLQPAVVDRPPGKVSPSIARPPTDADVAAVAAEIAAPPLLHVYPKALLRRADVRANLPEAALVVLDGVPRLPTSLARLSANVINIS